MRMKTSPVVSESAIYSAVELTVLSTTLYSLYRQEEVVNQWVIYDTAAHSKTCKTVIFRFYWK